MNRFLAIALALAACGPRPHPSPEPPADGPPAVPAAHGPPLLLIGVDGFRWDYLDRPPAATLRALAARGARAERLVPVFPTKTYPNFYTLVTGLYPARHGVVSNVMIDPTDGARFSPDDSIAVADPRWWGGEPIWTRLVKRGRRAMAFFWPGSEAPVGGVHLTEYRRYDGRVPNSERVRQVLAWLGSAEPERPALVAMYLSDTDDAGHRYGPDAPETDQAIGRVDSTIASLLEGLDRRDLTRRLNIVVVSDHGMAAVDSAHAILLDAYIDLNQVSVLELGPTAALIPDPGREDQVYAALAGRHPRLRGYRAETFPPAWRFAAHPRIPPVLAVADEGWYVTTRSQLSRPPNPGGHGYPPETLSMSGVLLAAGPDFRSGASVPAVSSVHVYSLLARVLGVDPAPNDGSLDSLRGLLTSKP
jgi:predicted AlkP superfamily pyrophosphatase or phosphodiesterase